MADRQLPYWALPWSDSKGCAEWFAHARCNSKHVPERWLPGGSKNPARFFFTTQGRIWPFYGHREGAKSALHTQSGRSATAKIFRRFEEADPTNKPRSNYVGNCSDRHRPLRWKANLSSHSTLPNSSAGIYPAKCVISSEIFTELSSWKTVAIRNCLT